MSDKSQSSVEVLSDEPARIYPRGGRGTGLALHLLTVFLLVIGIGLIAIGGYIGYTRVQNEYTDYQTMKLLLIYNMQQGKLLTLPQAPVPAPAAAAAPVPAPVQKPTEPPKK